MSKNFKSSVVTITGGTGSFGSTMVSDLLKQDVAEVRIFSRDENKQDAMRNSVKDERTIHFCQRNFSRILLMIWKTIHNSWQFIQTGT